MFTLELQLLQDSFTFFTYNFLLNVFELISHYNRVTDASVIVSNVTLVTFINILTFLMKIFIFYNFKNLCILHGHVFVMNIHS